MKAELDNRGAHEAATDQSLATTDRVEPTRDSSSPFVGKHELARRLNVHPRTVSRMVERGELPRPCMSDGGRPRWLWSFVVEFCHERHMKQAKLEQKLKRKLGESPGSPENKASRPSGKERIDGTRADTGLSRQGGRE